MQMHDILQNRLSSINEELIRMQFITTDPETGTNITNCMMTMTAGRLPSGTIDAEVYMSMVKSRKEKIASLTATLQEYRFMPPDDLHAKKREEERMISLLHEERMALYNILIDVAPVNTTHFRAKLESLIDEKMAIVERLRILQIQGVDIGDIF